MIITILSDSPFLPTGYSNQAKQLATYLTDRGHTVHYLANAYSGTEIKNAELLDGTKFNYTIHGHWPNNPYFNQTMGVHLRETKSEVFFILLDTFMLYPWFLNVDTAPAKTFFWFPSDGGAGMPKGCEAILKKIDEPVAMALFGQKQVKDYYGLDVKHIPHGTDSDRFYKLPDEERDKLREKWGFKDKFVVGVVARNQPRKNLDRTIKSFYLLKDRIPNAILFLHLDPNDPAQQAFKIHDLVTRYNLENRVVYSGMSAHNGFDWNRMNEVYNIMDVFLLTTSGEGFGIPIIEAMSCQVPVLATSYTTTPELVENNNAGLGIKLAGTEDLDLFSLSSQDYDNLVLNGTLTGSWQVERAMCSCTDCADKLVKLYKDPELRKEMGKNGRKAVLEKYDFNKHIGPKFEELMNNQQPEVNIPVRVGEKQ